MHRLSVSFAVLAAFTLSAFVSSAAFAQGVAKKKRGADAEGTPARRPLPESIKVERDFVYATYGDRKVMLDLYLPKTPASPKIPCIMCIHGGGWRSGDKNRFGNIAAALADKGFAVACIGYRLLPEVEFPAPVVDCKAAVRWVRANASQHGIDPDRIGAIGGSAGGHLGALLGTSASVKELEGDGGNPGVSSRVQAVVAMATPADMTKFAERAKMDNTLALLISPVTHVSKESAPVLLLHGTKDNVVPMAQSELLLEKYKTAGSSAELVKMEGGQHAFWNNSHFDETIQRATEFFRKTLVEPKSQDH